MTINVTNRSVVDEGRVPPLVMPAGLPVSCQVFGVQRAGVDDRCAELVLLRLEEVPDVATQRGLVDRDDVVAADDARLIESVGRADRDLGAETLGGRRDGRDAHATHGRPHRLARQHENRTRLVQVCDVDSYRSWFRLTPAARG